MPSFEPLLSAAEAARRLGVSVTTFYAWVGESKIGELLIRRQRVTIDYLQAGPKGQGRILLEAREVERLRELMRVRPQIHVPRARPAAKPTKFPGIHVPLGRPD